MTHAVDALEEEPLALQDDSELSLAGFEDKLLLVRTATGWARPVGGRPSTHILKRDNLRHPGIVDAEAAALGIAQTIGLTTIDPELVTLGEHRCLTVLIGNADAHAKNLALLHPTPETVALSPLYDTVPTALWPKLRRDAAMSVGGNRLLAAITVDDLEREARGWSIARSSVSRTVADAIERTRAAAADCDHEQLAAFVLRRADELCRT